jgi:hypothetical protein
VVLVYRFRSPRQLIGQHRPPPPVASETISRVRVRRGIAENSSLTVQNAPILATEKTSKIGTTKSRILVDSVIAYHDYERGRVIRLVRQRGNQVGFRAGTYARTLDGIVFIYGFDGGSYQAVRVVCLTDREEEGEYLVSDLTSWSPQNGERVVEANNDDSPVGIVVEAGEEISQVVWKNLRRQASWGNSYLEPVWTD